MEKYCFGIDVGGTNIKYALMDPEGEILEKGETPTAAETIEEHIDALAAIAVRYPQAEALVMSAPGRIDSSRGYFYTGGALTFVRETPLAELLSERLGIPVTAENDGKCAALAELWKGALCGVKNGVVMTLGTAVGGGLILDGKLRRGQTFAAGEFSWIPTDHARAYGIPTLWGTHGGAGALTGQYEERCGLGPGSVDGREFFSRLDAGDPAAQAALKDYAAYMAKGILSLQSVLDVEVFAIGGGISRQPALIEALDRAVGTLFGKHAAYLPMYRPRITACRFGNDANLIGALYHHLELAERAETVRDR